MELFNSFHMLLPTRPCDLPMTPSREQSAKSLTTVLFAPLLRTLTWLKLCIQNSWIDLAVQWDSRRGPFQFFNIILSCHPFVESLWDYKKICFCGPPNGFWNVLLEDWRSWRGWTQLMDLQVKELFARGVSRCFADASGCSPLKHRGFTILKPVSTSSFSERPAHTVRNLKEAL